MNRRVVITGIGAITPVGMNVSETWESIKAGKSGIKTIESFDTEQFDVKIAGEILEFDPTKYIEKKAARRMDRFTQFAVAASQQAVEDSKLDLEKIDRNRFGVIVGSGVGGMITLEEAHKNLFNKGPRRVSPFAIPMLISNMAAGLISITFGAKGPNYSVVTACATSTNSIGDAAKIIERGAADIMIAGGAEAAICGLGIGGFTSMKALSKRNDEPTKASRPFDKERDGFVMGEGAGILVLEDLQHALDRGATIYAEVKGYGMSSDAYHMTAPAPDGEGAARSMQNALDDANIKPEEVDYINAHGTSTPMNDKLETMAIKRVFGENAYNIPISSTKSMTGHLLGAAGAVEAMVMVKTINEGFIHPTINLENPDPDCDLNYVPHVGIKKEVKYAISNSFGFGGHNATLVFGKYE